MSYTISAKGANKAELIQDATKKFDAIVASQPVHAKDRTVALNAMENFVNMVEEPGDDNDLFLSMSGSVGGDWVNNNVSVLRSAACSVSVYVMQKPAPEVKKADDR